MIRKVFRQMLVAQILSAMTVMICMLIDSIMIGRFLGVDAMTAYGLATPVLLVFAAFGSMLSAGIQVMCGKTMGAGDREGTNAAFSVSVFLAGVVAFAGLAAVVLFASPLASFLGAGDPEPGNEIFFLTKDYLTGFIIGAPAFIFAQIMVPYMQFSGSRTRLAVAVLLMTVSDIAFDILNVFVFRGGTFGMGLASSLSYYIAFAIGALYFVKKDCMFRFRFRLVERARCAELLKYGIPTVLNQISLVLLVFVLNRILLGTGGSVAVAAYSVISTIGNLCYCFGAGVASVALLLSSVFYSDEDRTALLGLVRTMTRTAAGIVLVVTAAVLLAAPVLVPLFLTDDPAARGLAAEGLRLFSLSLVPSAVNAAFKNYYQGIDRTGLTDLISVLQNFVLPAIFAFLLSRFFGTAGAWCGYVCGECATLLLISGIVWKHAGKATISAEAYALLPESFGARAGEYIELTVEDAEAAVEASRAAAAFCREHGEDGRTSLLIPLCIEEIATNIVTHGFTKDRRQHSIEIRLLFKENKKTLRIRDNCVNFDPVDYMRLHEADDPTAHIGIRMVMRMVKDASYVNSLGLNNLTLVM